MTMPFPHATEPVAHNIDKELLRRYSRQAADSSVIDPELYRTYNVKRGLRNADGSGLATSRLLPAIVEQFQRADGSVVIPEVLRPFLGGASVIEPPAK